MELPNHLLEQIVFIKRPKIEEHMLMVLDKSTYEEHLPQPLQANKKQFERAITFFTGYNGIFNVTKSNSKFYFAKSVNDEHGYIQNSIPIGAYEIESLNSEFKRIIIEEEHFTEADYPFTIKPNFSTPGSKIEIFRQGPIITFLPMIAYEIFWDSIPAQFMKNINYQPIRLIFYHLTIFLSIAISLRE